MGIQTARMVYVTFSVAVFAFFSVTSDAFLFTFFFFFGSSYGLQVSVV